MDRLTAEELRADPRFPWDRLQLPVGDPDPLEAEEDLAWAYVEAVTARDLDTITDPGLVALAKEALTLVIVQQAVAKGTGFQILLSEQSGVASFSVPGYSETRFGPTQMRRGATAGYMINPYPELDRILWLLATEAKRDEWLFLSQGRQVPTLGITHNDQRPYIQGIERGLY